MLNRFTDEARQVLVLAREEARAAGADQIGTEHLLLGLMCDDRGLAASSFAACGVAIESVRSSIGSRSHSSDRPAATAMWLSADAKTVLELSLHEAMSESSYENIKPEHILLALVKSTDERVGRILDEHQIDWNTLRRTVLNRFPTRPGAGLEVSWDVLKESWDPERWLLEHS